MKRSIAKERKRREAFMFTAKAVAMMALWELAIGLWWPELVILRNGLAVLCVVTWTAVLLIVLYDMWKETR